MEFLTKGAISAVSNGETNLEPCVQVLDVRLIGTQQTTQERYRTVLSDGIHTHQAMLATQLNHLVNSNQLQKGSIVKLTEFVCNTIQNRRIIIVINLVVVAEKCDMIGEPKPYTDGNANAAAAPQARSSMPAHSTSPIGQQGSAAGNPQSLGNSYAAEPQAVQNVPSGAPKYPKPESVTGYSGSTAVTRNISDPPQNLVRQNQNSSNPEVAGGPAPAFNNTYGRPVPQPTYQPPPIHVNRGPIAKNEAPARIVPIAALNPYQGRWTIKARVTAKGELRRYNNPRGEGKVFSFDLLDSDGGEIRVTCFNAVADQFYDQIEVGKVYLISKGSLKPAQKNFNHLNNEWEIFLESTSTIEPSLEDNSIPRQQFNFRSISDIEDMENNSMVDLIGIVESINPSSSVSRKNGIVTQKRTLQLKDKSGKSVELTLWGNLCNSEGQQLQDTCNSGVFPVLAVKAGRVNDFNGKSVGTISTSQLFIDPDFPEAQELMGWFNREGKNRASLSISKDTLGLGHTDVRKTVSQIKDEGLGRSEKPDWITVRAVISSIKFDNFCYMACPLMVGDRKCNKKVSNNADGTWHCERCDQNFPECECRYLLPFEIRDHTDSTWVTAFQEVGEEIIGIPAKDLYLLKHEEQDDSKFLEIKRRVLFRPYLFKLKVKEEQYGDEHRVKSIVVKVETVDFAFENKYIAGLIEKLSGRDPNVATGTATNIGSDSGLYHANSGDVVMSNGRNNFVNNTNRYGMASVNQSGQYMKESSGFIGRISCENCGGAGHNSQNCPRGSYGQPVGTKFSNIGGVGGASDRCYKCNQGGHWAKDCPGSGVIPAAYGHSGAMERFGTRSSSYSGGF